MDTLKDQILLNKRQCRPLSYYEKYSEEFSILYPGCTIEESVSLILSGLDEIPTCPICNNKCKPIKPSHGHWTKFCSTGCKKKSMPGRTFSYSKERKKEIDLKKKKSFLEKYGEDHPLKTKNVQDKIKQTNLERYGVEYVLSDKGIQDKIKQTNLERYGVEHTASVPSIRKRMSSTWLKTYFDRYPGLYEFVNYELPTYFDKILTYTDLYELIPENLKVNYQFIESECIKNGIVFDTTRSVCENEVSNFLTSMGIDHVVNSRSIIPPFELDIFIPSHNIAIEINGVYWHSTRFLNRDYHLNKTNMCEESGIHLLHMYDLEWNDPITKEIWKSVICHKLNLSPKTIYSRKCSIEIIDSKNAADFMTLNHLQGSVKSSISIGLFHEGELVSVGQFGTSRFKSSEVELLRFANKLYYSIPGSFSKIISFYLREFKIKEIISYANRRWSMGNVYGLFGELVSITPPGYSYLVDGKLQSRHKYQKHKLNVKLEKFDPNLTETENMSNNGFYQVYDSGNLKYIIK